MALVNLDITENYAAFEILTEDQLNEAMQSIETFINTNIKLNFQQIGFDVFGNTYEYNNDGVQTVTPSLSEQVPFLDQDEEITGAWTFKDTVVFEQPVIFESTVSSSGQPRAKAFRDVSVQAIPDATSTAVILNAEVYDIGDLHDIVVNPGRMTIPSGMGGSYSFTAMVAFESSNVGLRYITITKNGSAIATIIEPNPDNTNFCYLQLQVDDEANVGDYYELRAFQSSGGDLSIIKNLDTTYFSCRKVW